MLYIIIIAVIIFLIYKSVQRANAKTATEKIQNTPVKPAAKKSETPSAPSKRKNDSEKWVALQAEYDEFQAKKEKESNINADLSDDELSKKALSGDLFACGDCVAKIFAKCIEEDTKPSERYNRIEPYIEKTLGENFIIAERTQYILQYGIGVATSIFLGDFDGCIEDADKIIEHWFSYLSKVNLKKLNLTDTDKDLFKIVDESANKNVYLTAQFCSAMNKPVLCKKYLSHIKKPKMYETTGGITEIMNLLIEIESLLNKSDAKDYEMKTALNKLVECISAIKLPDSLISTSEALILFRALGYGTYLQSYKSTMKRRAAEIKVHCQDREKELFDQIDAM